MPRDVQCQQHYRDITYGIQIFLRLLKTTTSMTVVIRFIFDSSWIICFYDNHKGGKKLLQKSCNKLNLNLGFVDSSLYKNNKSLKSV